MPYESAIEKSWNDLAKLSNSPIHNVDLLGDTYEVNLKNRQVLSNSCNVPTKDHVTLLLLHYLIGSLKNVYIPSGQWISFKEVGGGEIYYPAFREGVIKPILRKYGNNPEALFSVLERFEGAKIDISDASIEVRVFPDVNVRIILWKADEEFGPEANILFDKNLTKIYTMEDITVLSHFIVGNI